MDDDERGEETRHCSDGVLSNKTTALHPACRLVIVILVTDMFWSQINRKFCSDGVVSNNTTALHLAYVDSVFAFDGGIAYSRRYDGN